MSSKYISRRYFKYFRVQTKIGKRMRPFQGFDEWKEFKQKTIPKLYYRIALQDRDEEYKLKD